MREDFDGLRLAFQEHVRTDAYSTLDEAMREELPGAKVGRHLLPRYAVTWSRPIRSGSGV